VVQMRVMHEEACAGADTTNSPMPEDFQVAYAQVVLAASHVLCGALHSRGSVRSFSWPGRQTDRQTDRPSTRHHTVRQLSLARAC
jgi:hypothetical protein